MSQVPQQAADISGIAPATGALEDAIAQAVLKLQHLERDALTHLRSIRERQKDLVRTRFEEGRVVSELLASGQYGDAVVERLSQATGISPAILYDCRKFFELPQFGRQRPRLEAWITETAERKGAVTWSYARNVVRKSLPRDAEAARRRLDEEIRRVEKRAERLEEDAEEMYAEAERAGSPEQRDEAAGVRAKARQIKDDMARVQPAPVAADTSGQVKPSRHRDEAYLDHVRSHCCAACMAQQAEAHHLLGGGMGTKGTDLSAVPLCRKCHAELHMRGPRTFQKMHNFELWAVAWRLVVAYYAGWQQ